MANNKVSQLKVGGTTYDINLPYNASVYINAVHTVGSVTVDADGSNGGLRIFSDGFTKYPLLLPESAQKHFYFPSSSGTLAIKSDINPALYNLGYYDTISGSTITRKTGYLRIKAGEWALMTTSTPGKDRFVCSQYKDYIKKPSSTGVVADIVCSAYTTQTGDAIWSCVTGICVDSGGSICVFDSTYAPNGTTGMNNWITASKDLVVQYKLDDSKWYTERVVTGCSNTDDLNLVGRALGHIGAFDILSPDRKTVIRKTGYLHFTGQENWVNHGGGIYRLSIGYPNYNLDTIDTVIAGTSYVPGNPWNTNNGVLIDTAGQNYRAVWVRGSTLDSSITDLASFKAYMYTHHLDIQFKLATGYSEPLIADWWNNNQLNSVDLLWNNASPTSSFSGQNVTVGDMSNYKYIIVLVSINSSYFMPAVFKFQKELNKYFIIDHAYAGKTYYRQCKIESETSIQFSGAYENTTENNGYLTPYAVYGTNVL